MAAEASPATAAPIVMDLELRAERSQLGLARRYIAKVCAEFGLDAAGTGELVHAVNEAVTNAIRHGAPDSSGRIRIGLVASAQRLVFKVSDHGSFVMPLDEPKPDDGHGRGFTLMRRFTDHVSLCAGPGGTTVMLVKELR